MVKSGPSHSGSKGHTRTARRADTASRERYVTIGSVLSDYISGHPEFRYQVKIREALLAWHRISDEYAARHTEAVLVKNQILYVNTDSSALASELTLRGQELLKRINRELGTPILRRILFKSGRVARQEIKEGQKNLSTGEESGPRGPDAVPRLTAGVLKRIENTVNVIEEEQLREIMKRFLHVAAARSRREE